MEKGKIDVEKIKENEEKKMFQNFQVPVLICNPGPNAVKKESIEVMQSLIKLVEDMELTSYSYDSLQGVAGVFIGDGTNTAYSFHEILLKLMNYFPAKTDILRTEEFLKEKIEILEEKIDLLLNK